jgi:hypothetical protein
MRNLWVLELWCGHQILTADSKPPEQLDLFCHYCFKQALVRKRRPIWYIRCLGCRYAKSFGASPYTAHRAADAHQKRRPDHRMQIWEADQLREVRVPQMMLRPLPLNSAPPF